MTAFAGRRDGIAVSSGTAALEIAVAVLDIGPAAGVIVPPFTIISFVLQASVLATPRCSSTSAPRHGTSMFRALLSGTPLGLGVLARRVVYAGLKGEAVSM